MKIFPTVTVLGARGSVPISGAEFERYGGATVCMLVQLEGQTILLDAGTGLLNLHQYLSPSERTLPLLLSHAHVDHVLGLPLCPATLDETFRFDIYGMSRAGQSVAEQVGKLMHPPLWPVTPQRVPAKIRFHELLPSFSIGAVQVDVMEGVHPDGISLIRLTGGGVRVVYATDCTFTQELLPALTAFAKDCDLLLCDGQYDQEEWCTCQAFGHSTWEAAARLGAACGARQTRVLHHAPNRTDAALDAATAALSAICPGCAFARAGEEIAL